MYKILLLVACEDTTFRFNANYPILLIIFMRQSHRNMDTSLTVCITLCLLSSIHPSSGSFLSKELQNYTSRVSPATVCSESSGCKMHRSLLASLRHVHHEETLQTAGFDKLVSRASLPVIRASAFIILKPQFPISKGFQNIALWFLVNVQEMTFLIPLGELNP